MKSYLSLIPISAKVRKRQNRMTLLCIIISVFLVTAIFSVAETFLRTEEKIMRNKHGNWHIQINDLSPDIAKEISHRTDVAAVGWQDSFNVDAAQPYYIGEKRAAFYGTDETYFTQLMNALEEGTFPQQDNEVVLSPNAKIALDVELGDSVTVHTPGGDMNFTISGFGTDDGDAYERQPFLVAVYVTQGAFHNLMSQNGISESPICYIQFQSAEKASRAKVELQENIGIQAENISENTAIMGIAGQSDNTSINGIYSIAIFLFVLVMIAGALMISGSLNSSVAQRTQFFGMMRCVGASRQQIIRFVRLEALNWCKTAVPIGLVSGTVISWGVCAYLRYGVGGGEFSTMPIFTFSPVGVISGILVGVCTVWLAAQAPAKRAAKVSPVLAVSGNSELSKGTRHIIRFHFGRIESTLGVHHATASGKNWFLMTSSYALSIILFLCFSVGLTFAGALLPSNQVYQPDVALNGYANALLLEPNMVDEIKNVTGVENAYGTSYISNISVTSSRPDISQINLESYDDTMLELVKDIVVQGELSAIFGNSHKAITVYNKDNPLEIGDVIQIGEKEVEITCTISSSLYPGEFLVICSQETFTWLTGEHNYSLIGIKLNAKADDTTLRQINRLVGSDVIVTDDREANKSNNSTFTAVQGAAYGFLLIISMIALFYTINSISISVGSRSKQYGAMRAVGMSNEQLTRMIYFEALTYAISGLIAGFGFGIPLSWALHDRLVTRYFGTPWHCPVTMLCIIIAFIFACSVIAVYAPAKRIRGMAITETINEL